MSNVKILMPNEAQNPNDKNLMDSANIDLNISTF